MTNRINNLFLSQAFESNVHIDLALIFTITNEGIRNRYFPRVKQIHYFISYNLFRHFVNLLQNPTAMGSNLRTFVVMEINYC